LKEKNLLLSNHSPWKRRPLLCHPERTRISCHAAQDRATCAPFSKERRMEFANATNFNRKSGEAEGSAVSLAHYQMLMQALLFPLVIPTEAYPDFLPRSTRQGRVCAFP
jgi:hypothetical protein